MTGTTPSAIKTIKIWLNAFIPKDLPGLTNLVPAGSHAGKTMIEGPIPSVSDCYLTDNRSFSSDSNASSRMHSEIVIALPGPRMVSQVHRCDPTHEIDCEDGEEECTKSADTSAMGFISLRTESRLIKVGLTGSAGNPCQTGAPFIEYKGDITIDIDARTLEFKGEIEPFPAFEMYASVNDESPVTVFQIMPEAGRSPFDLFGSPNVLRNDKISF